MIRFFLLQNKQGKTRLTKWFVEAPDDDDRLKMENEINRTITLRSKKLTNFCEYQHYKIIYRKYASLFFVFGVDASENELLAMETIHLLVEILDEYFDNVCEASF
jgi:AP-2 complex subunit sigma-1